MKYKFIFDLPDSLNLKVSSVQKAQEILFLFKQHIYIYALAFKF
jgi:hypothetical protein